MRGDSKVKSKIMRKMPNLVKEKEENLKVDGKHGRGRV